MYIGNKRLHTTNGGLVNRAHTKHELGGDIQSSHYHSPLNVFRQ